MASSDRVFTTVRSAANFASVVTRNRIILPPNLSGVSSGSVKPWLGNKTVYSFQTDALALPELQDMDGYTELSKLWRDVRLDAVICLVTISPFKVLSLDPDSTTDSHLESLTLQNDFTQFYNRFKSWLNGVDIVYIPRGTQTGNAQIIQNNELSDGLLRVVKQKAGTPVAISYNKPINIVRTIVSGLSGSRGVDIPAACPWMPTADSITGSFIPVQPNMGVAFEPTERFTTDENPMIVGTEQSQFEIKIEYSYKLSFRGEL